ncbi:hypothetical protein SFUMM280S_06252 [Streptomyces fumanus]
MFSGNARAPETPLHRTPSIAHDAFTGTTGEATRGAVTAPTGVAP